MSRPWNLFSMMVFWGQSASSLRIARLCRHTRILTQGSRGGARARGSRGAPAGLGLPRAGRHGSPRRPAAAVHRPRSARPGGRLPAVQLECRAHRRHGCGCLAQRVLLGLHVPRARVRHHGAVELCVHVRRGGLQPAASGPAPVRCSARRLRRGRHTPCGRRPGGGASCAAPAAASSAARRRPAGPATPRPAPRCSRWRWRGPACAGRPCTPPGCRGPCGRSRQRQARAPGRSARGHGQPAAPQT